MKTLIRRILARRYLLVAVAVAATPLFPFVTSALFVLETARRGVLGGMVSAAAGIAGIAIIAFVLGDAVPYLMVLAAVAMLAGVAMGTLLRWSGTLALAFQGTVAICVIAALAASLVGPDPNVWLAPMIDRLVEAFRESGASQQELAALAAGAPMLFRVIMATLLLQALGALLLGYWWVTLVRDTAGFGSAFRALRLGRVLGITAMVLLVLGMIPAITAVQDVSPLLVFCFLFQGLAVVHAWAHARQWHPMLTSTAYILLIPPLMPLGVLGLSGIGLVDNIFDLRAPLSAPS